MAYVGAAYERRPRVVNEEKQARITTMLQSGYDYQKIADEVGGEERFD